MKDIRNFTSKIQKRIINIVVDKLQKGVKQDVEGRNTK